MKKSAIAVGLLAAMSAVSLARADDVTIIQRDADVDTTGSIVIKKPVPRVVVRESPAIVVRERTAPRVVIREREPDVVIKEKRRKLVID